MHWLTCEIGIREETPELGDPPCANWRQTVTPQPELGMKGVELIPRIDVFVHDTYWVWGNCDSLAYNVIPLKHQVAFVVRK